MPVEIKELIIRTVVNDASAGDDESEESTGSNNSDNEAIIQECVRQVLSILDRNKER
jgi:hypothetical protein